MFGALLLFVLRLPDGRALGISQQVSDFWAVSRRLRRLGYPLAAARGLETTAFAALVMLAGNLGTVPLAAYQIGYNLIGLVFMVAIGTAAASMIRVGNAVGRRNPTDISRAGWAGVLLIAFLMACFAGPFLGLGMPLARLYTDDPAVLPLAASLIGICGIILVFDGMQAVLMGALRGIADVWVPPGLQLISWWCINGAHRLRAGLRGRDRRRRPDVGRIGGCAERQHPAFGPLPRCGTAPDRPLLRGVHRGEGPVWRPKMATVGP